MNLLPWWTLIFTSSEFIHANALQNLTLHDTSKYLYFIGTKNLTAAIWVWNSNLFANFFNSYKSTSMHSNVVTLPYISNIYLLTNDLQIYINAYRSTWMHSNVLIFALHTNDLFTTGYLQNIRTEYTYRIPTE